MEEMRIMHYFLGFPPYRSGGLTKYATDLMNAQAEDGHAVMALWPGRIKFVVKNTSIKKHADIYQVENYEIINPLPVSLDEGISDIGKYTAPCSSDCYERLLIGWKPDVIHIHTLMGLHSELICTANAMGIRSVFTAHDYFGICPKVTLYRYGGVCDDDHCCWDCIPCNCRALSLKKIVILQSPVYRALKDSVMVKAFRKRHRAEFFAEEKAPIMPEKDTAEAARQYVKLREYYLSMLRKVDFIHFNSTVTENIYTRYFQPKNSRVISITHKNIVDNRNGSVWEPTDILRITCLSPAKPFKGFSVLKKALDELWNDGNHNLRLNLFGTVQNPAEYMNIREDGYAYSELKGILQETDVLAAPSVWYETFGFTVLEALSYGVPVIVSDRMGAKDIVGEGGVVVEAGNAESLKQAICSLNQDKLRRLRKNIRENGRIKLWSQLMEETYQLYGNI